MIDPKFKEWACSFSGCDGGDPSSPIWLCGIEWGFPNDQGQAVDEFETRKMQFYTEELTAEIAKGAYQPGEYQYFLPERWQYPFVRNFGKLIGVISGMSVYELEQIKTASERWNIFHMNLYPIKFPNESDELWQKYGLPNVTGLQSKQIYRTWCLLRRFPWMAEQVKKHQPRLIIGTGIGYLTDFIVCCGGSGIVDDIHCERLVGDENNSGNSSRTLYWTKVSSQTTLAVVPFMTSRFGLNSNVLIEKFGSRIREVAGV